MNTKRGLGKGLDSMIPKKISEPMKEDQKNELKQNVSRETLVNINLIEPNSGQPRRNFDEDTLQELVESIKQYGIIQPLILKKNKDKYIIVAGERRWRASRLAGLKEVPAVIKDYSTQEVMEIALIENIQREDLNPIEEALAYQNLMQEYGLKHDEVAEKISKSRAAVTNAMRLLKLDSRVQQMLIDEMITSGHARALLPIEDKEKQYEIALKIFDLKLSVRETEKLIKKLLKDESTSETSKKQVDEALELVYKNIENKIRDIVGTKVVLHKKDNNKGKIEIEYYSSEELERLVELFESIR